MSDDNLLERAKALRETALPRRICSIPGQTGYGNPSLNKGWDFSAVDELVRVVVPELITEVERLRSDQDAIMAAWDKDAVEHDARIKELEAAVVDGRAQYLLFLDCNPDCTAWNFDELLEEDQNTLRRQARISLKMEEPWVYVQLREAREQIKRLEAAFLKAEKANLMHHMDADYADENAREALERIKEGRKSA